MVFMWLWTTAFIQAIGQVLFLTLEQSLNSSGCSWPQHTHVWFGTLQILEGMFQGFRSGLLSLSFFFTTA